MTAVAMPPAMSHNNNGIIQVVNESNLTKIERYVFASKLRSIAKVSRRAIANNYRSTCSFLNDTAYREAIENSSNYNSRLCRERRLRMPFLDSQTGKMIKCHGNFIFTLIVELMNIIY